MSELINKEVYSDIYRIMRENAYAAGKDDFPYSEGIYLSGVGGEPNVVDLNEYLSLDNVDFLFAIYIAVVHEAPTDEFLEEWLPRTKMEREAFQELYLRSIEERKGVAINRIRFISNPYFEQNRGVRYFVLGSLYAITTNPTLKRIGQHLPKGIWKVLKRELK